MTEVVEEGPMSLDDALARAGVTEQNLVEIEMDGHDLLLYTNDGRCTTITLVPKLADEAARLIAEMSR